MTQNISSFFNSSKRFSYYMSETELDSLIHKVINDIKAKSRYEYHISTDNLFEAGFVGFVKATTSFDPSMGAKFSTFCYRLIHNEICNRRNQLSTKELSISSLQGRYADDEDDKVCILDIYSSGESADNELVREDLRYDLKRVLYAILGNRNAEIIFGRFGLQGKVLSNKELGKVYNLSDERVRQVIEKGLKAVFADETARTILCKYRLSA